MVLPSVHGSPQPSLTFWKQKNPDIYVQETLLQVMVDEFDTVIDIGSAVSVAADIVKLW